MHLPAVMRCSRQLLPLVASVEELELLLSGIRSCRGLGCSCHKLGSVNLATLWAAAQAQLEQRTNLMRLLATKAAMLVVRQPRHSQMPPQHSAVCLQPVSDNETAVE